MNSILLSHSYFLRFDRKQWSLGLPYAPLGTMYAAALLRENGFSVSIHDTMFSRSADEITNSLEKIDPEIFVTNMRRAAFDMIRHAKKRGCTVIVSSSDSTDHYPDYLQQGADFIVLGEAEIT